MNHCEEKEGSRPISDLDACEIFAWRSYVADIIVAYGPGCLGDNGKQRVLPISRERIVTRGGLRGEWMN